MNGTVHSQMKSSMPCFQKDTRSVCPFWSFPASRRFCAESFKTFFSLACSPDLASASRLRAHSHAGPQVVRHSDAHRGHDGLPHAGGGPHHQADERPAVWKPAAPQTRRHPVFRQTAGRYRCHTLQLRDCPASMTQQSPLNRPRWRWTSQH